MMNLHLLVTIAEWSRKSLQTFSIVVSSLSLALQPYVNLDFLIDFVAVNFFWKKACPIFIRLKFLFLDLAVF